MTTPTLSVVIPTWNRGHIVCEAIESALDQRPGQVEVIVVDDGSTDNTAEVVGRNFGGRIVFLRLSRRQGAGAARNAGLRRASGELISLLDSDDIWLPGKLDAELRALERFPGAEAVVSNSQSFIEGQAEGRTRFAQNGLLEAVAGQARWLSECRWLWTNSRNTVSTSAITFRRGLLARLGLKFAEDLICCEDWEFALRVYHLCRVVVLPEVWTHARSFEDGSRIGRRISGKPASQEQEFILLRDRLKVMERSHWLSGLRADLAAELERYRADTARELARFARPKAAGGSDSF